MKKGPGHTAEEALKVFRTVAAHLEQNPELLRIEGVFRLSANSKNPPEIVKRILKNKSLNSKSFIEKGYSVHDFIGSLKESLKNNVLLANSHPYLGPLQDAFAKVDTSKKESLQEVTNVINQLIENLAESKKSHDRAVAEVLHTYLHLTHLAASLSENNKMTPTNLAVAAIGPVFMNNVILSKDPNDPMEMMSLSSKAMPIAEEAIQSNRYDYAFKDRHHARVVDDPQPIIDQLEENLRVLADQRDQDLIPQAVYDKMVQAISNDVQKRKEEISRFVPSSGPSVSSRSEPSASSSSSSSSSVKPPKIGDVEQSKRRSIRFLDEDGVPKVPKTSSSKGSRLMRSVSKLTSKKAETENVSPEDSSSKKSRTPRQP